jgi:hypothetical protein
MKYKINDIIVLKNGFPMEGYEKGSLHTVIAFSKCPCCDKDTVGVMNPAKKKIEWIPETECDLLITNMSLEDQLTAALAKEDYIEAARLRDLINVQQ